MKILTISVPQYSIETEPDHKSIGKPIDDLLKEHFMGQKVLIRGLGSMEHPGKSLDEVIEIMLLLT